ncbi:MAG TPA: YggS family pyridoxal phosphate-dependent enzyme [Flavihumibacter sp.]
MSVNFSNYEAIKAQCARHNAQLVAVSKLKPVSTIKELYDAGHRDFGENYVQELMEKQPQLPDDVRWHFIGHLQSNKVKYIAGFVHLIHGVDSQKLLKEISKQALRAGRTIDCLLQVYIASEETKFGLDEAELETLVNSLRNEPETYRGVRIRGMMGMASFSENEALVRREFQQLVHMADRWLPSVMENPAERILSFGMSNDYKIALEEGSTLVRIGSLLFGARS